MKKEILLSIILILLFFSCDNSGNCSVSLQLAKEQSCNIIVTDNINKSQHCGGIELINPKGNPENVPLEYYLINSPHD